jgi:hypothetical protein
MTVKARTAAQPSLILHHAKDFRPRCSICGKGNVPVDEEQDTYLPDNRTSDVIGPGHKLCENLSHDADLHRTIPMLAVYPKIAVQNSADGAGVCPYWQPFALLTYPANYKGN